MSAGPLHDALRKLKRGDVAIDAPEWSNRDGKTLLARLTASVLLLVLVGSIVFNVRDTLPGETQSDKLVAAFTTRATDATAATVKALTTRQSTTETLRESRAALASVREDDDAERADRREAREQRDTALRAAEAARRAYRTSVAARSSALEDALAVRPTSDVDLVRAIGLGALALVALIGAGALLAPRSQVLSVRRLHQPTIPAMQAPTTPPANAPPAVGVAAGASPGASGAGGPPPAASVTKAEPALTQGVIGAVALAAGLFGIQETEGTTEILLNLALPLVPIAGALFTRARVAARPNLSTDERQRLFGG